MASLKEFWATMAVKQALVVRSVEESEILPAVNSKEVAATFSTRNRLQIRGVKWAVKSLGALGAPKAKRGLSPNPAAIKLAEPKGIATAIVARILSTGPPTGFTIACQLRYPAQATGIKKDRFCIVLATARPTLVGFLWIWVRERYQRKPTSKRLDPTTIPLYS